jgi:hypothetical protein
LDSESPQGIANVKKRIAQLRQRLIAANLRSRSIRLSRTTRSGALDLCRLVKTNRPAVRDLLKAMGLSEHATIDLVPVKSGDEDEKAIGEDLRRIHNAARETWMEVGEDELLLGWPFIEAKLDDTWLRAPLLLYPVSLGRSRKGRLTWQLELTGPPDVNEVLTQTVFRLVGARLDIDRLIEIDIDKRLRPDDESWTAIETWLEEGGLTLLEKGQGLPRLRPVKPREKEDRNGYPDGRVELIDHLVLGRFSQASSNVLVDYNELENHLELLERGPAAELLAVDPSSLPTPQDPETPKPQDPETPKPQDPIPRGRVLPSDASQEAVILALDDMDGRGLVVRGPPGTGKSQLISNLVGQAIDRGETVLVICQKRAALDVVADRLGSINLSAPLALVHDVHHDRARFALELAATLDGVLDSDLASRSASSEHNQAISDYETAIERFRVRLEASEAAYDQMTAIGPGGRTLAELFERALDDDRRPLPDISAEAPEVSEEDAIRIMPEIEALVLEARPFAAPHPLAARADWSGYGEAGLEKLRGRLVEFRDQLSGLADPPEGATMTAAEAEEHGGLFEECASWLELFRGGDVDACNEFALFWAFSDAEDQEGGFQAVVDRLETAREALTSVPAGLFAADTMTILDYVSQLEELAELRAKWFRFVLPRYWALRGLPGRVQSNFAGEGTIGTEIAARPEADRMLALCKMTQEWHALVREVSEVSADFPFFEFGCSGQIKDLEQSLDGVGLNRQRVTQLHRLQDGLSAWNPVYEDLPDLAADPPYESRPFIQAVLADWGQRKRYIALEKRGDALADGFERPWLDRLVEGAAHGTPDLGAINAVLEAWKEAQAAVQVDQKLTELPPWAGTFLRQYGPEDEETDLEPDVLLSLERGWRRAALAGKSVSQAEAALVSSSHSRALAKAYMEMINSAGPAARARYRLRLAGDAADSERGRALRTILTDARKKRHRRSIRQFVERYWNEGLARLRPVWLCSPESAAALFPLEPGLFDTIVMDEASQCPVEAALPALVRAKRVVIAGDEKQMPPSHFFMRRGADDLDEDEEESALLAAESVLDIARVAYPGTMLRFHYRSRHEELITYSNHAFYDGGLVTAPPARISRLPSEGIHFEQVDGLWKDQVNRVEADRVVDRVIELLQSRLPNGKIPSVGIVTFNLKQQRLIQQLLDERADDDEKARDVFNADAHRPPNEALFVKNLENVQGDERDLIVFSTAYGPTRPGGRVFARFGPLGQEGGEHRLNVAVTRAKYGIHVISSFTPSALDVAGTKRAGPKFFKAYLEYAKQSAAHDESGIERVLAELADLAEETAERAPVKPRSDRLGVRVRDQLAEALESEGLEVCRDFGIGPYRLDLAVKHPLRPDSWACGIDCSRFLGLANTLQRDISEPSFWRRAGWKLIRVSPAMWWDRREDVLHAVVKAAGRE